MLTNKQKISLLRKWADVIEMCDKDDVNPCLYYKGRIVYELVFNDDNDNYFNWVFPSGLVSRTLVFVGDTVYDVKDGHEIFVTAEMSLTSGDYTLFN